MAVEYEALVQEGHAKFAQEIFKKVKKEIDGINVRSDKIYGFCIDQDKSDPAERVSYILDAVGAVPFTMNMTTGEANYGSWENAFFMPKPCMLKFDGTVDYYLDPNDFSKKVDGTDSDVDDPTYDGNAMMQWPIIYTKYTQVENKLYARFANYKVDDSYHCYSNTTKSGTKKPFYTPIYNGSLISGKMRSLSGQTISKSLTAANERAYCQANGANWDMEFAVDRLLIWSLCYLIGKSTNLQGVFGQGYSTGGTTDNMKPTGTTDDKGLFYGLSDTSTPVKVFGMENLWGQQYRRQLGWMMINGVQKFKATYGTEDGSTVTDFNITGDGYVTLNTETFNITSEATSGGGYYAICKATPFGFILEGKVDGASASTHYCDYMYFNLSGTRMAFVGGGSVYGVKCGACVHLGSEPGYAGWDIGASPSYRPAA